MQALIELIAGFVTMLVVVVLSQFGLNVDMPNKPEREIRRVNDCDDQRATVVIDAASDHHKNC